MTIQQKLANRIYELLPHKKELEFGCQFMVFDSKRTVIEVDGDEVINIVNGVIFSSNIENIKNSPNIEIIGQPIRLADILLAINSLTDAKRLYPRDINIDDRGMLRAHFALTECLSEKYNLEKDNILDQSDLFCEFVYKLLE